MELIGTLYKKILFQSFCMYNSVCYWPFLRNSFTYKLLVNLTNNCKGNSTSFVQGMNWINPVLTFLSPLHWCIWHICIKSHFLLHSSVLSLHASSGERSHDLGFASGVLYKLSYRNTCYINSTVWFDRLIGLDSNEYFCGESQLGKRYSAEVSHFLEASPVCLQSASDTH